MSHQNVHDVVSWLRGHYELIDVFLLSTYDGSFKLSYFRYVIHTHHCSYYIIHNVNSTGAIDTFRYTFTLQFISQKSKNHTFYHSRIYLLIYS